MIAEINETARNAPIMVTAVITAVVWGIKQIPKMPKWPLPLLAMGIGLVAYCLLTSWAVYNAMDGLVVGAAAVGFREGLVNSVGALKKEPK